MSTNSAKSKTKLKESGNKGILPSSIKGKYMPLTLKLVDTGEVFNLKNITTMTTIKELKSYLEFSTGIPVNLQRLHYLDEGELQDNTDIRSNDIVAGGQLHMTIWHTWVKLINAVVHNNISEVLKMGVTPDSTYRTPNANYMNAKGVQAWLAERAFVALFVACHRGHVKLVQTLVNSGADVNMKTTLGRTPLHVSAAQNRGSIVDTLLNNGADVNEVDNMGDTALAIAERFDHKDGARHLFLFRWQVRAAQAEKVAAVPLYYHQQCDTANPVWLSGNQGQLYYAARDQFLDEYAGSGLDAAPAQTKPAEIPPESRTTLKVGHDEWLSQKQKDEEIKSAVVKAEKAAKKLEEEKRKEQNLIDKESYDTWIKMQQEQKEKHVELKKRQHESKQKQAPTGKELSSKGMSSVRSSENFESDKEGDSNLTGLLQHIKVTNLHRDAYDDLLFQNDHETFDRVKNIQYRRAADRKNQAIVPLL